MVAVAAEVISKVEISSFGEFKLPGVAAKVLAEERERGGGGIKGGRASLIEGLLTRAESL